MRIISNMATTRNPKLYVRTTNPLRSALKRVLSGLVASSVYARRHRLLSQEVVVNASWLMMQDMDPEELAAKLAPYVARAEAILNSEPAQSDATGPADPPSRQPVMGHDVPPGPKRTPRRKSG